jgi:hypothetical protein
MERAGYQIDKDNAEEGRFHVHFLERGEDTNDRGFEVILTHESFQIQPREGSEIIPFDPMAPFTLERQYTCHKHNDARRDMDFKEDVANVMIGGSHDLSAYMAGNPHPNTDCEALFRIHGHMFMVKRTRRDRNIQYYIKGMEHNHILRFKYPFQ